MEIFGNGKLYDENLRHPISAYYVQGNSDSIGFPSIIMGMFGVQFWSRR